MNAPLFPLLALLTLLDLAFVQATDVVAFADLSPLWALTLAAGPLRRLQRFATYRAAWNIGVVAVFALLVHHATTTGLLHMLEDGLVLAVLCQVHLLNNVGDRQRPDLVFFNSFLIAFVTSFFAADLTWSLLFVAHAFVLVPSLQLHSLLGVAPDGVVPASVVRALLRASGPQTLLIGALTGVAFVVWPRDFQREGWLGSALQQRAEAGLTERIRLDDERPTSRSDDLVARFTPVGDQGTTVPTHWRAIVFTRFTEGTWLPQEPGELGPHAASDPVWENHGSLWTTPVATPNEPAPRVRVQQVGGDRRRLLLPLAAVAMRLHSAAGRQLEPTAFGGFRALQADDAPAEALDYEVTLGNTSAVRVPPRARRLLTALPDQELPAALHALAAQLRTDLPPDAPALERAAATSDWLEQHRRYQLPGGPGFARNLGEFLLGSGAGHCEYFATALALLLRSQGVPCRLAGGFLVSEAEPGSDTRIARGKHAHAWVEVLDETGAWHTFDATPAADVLAATVADTPSQWAIWTTMKRWWGAVATFDQRTRADWLQALRDPTSPTMLTFLGTSVAGLALVLFVRRRRTEPTLRALQRAMQRARLQLLPGETPRELASRAARTGLAPHRLAHLRDAMIAHERARYGAPATSTADRP